ncbi:MAG TPA: translocated intimin receptor Tir [Terracidiphilus sp.]|nr:translocated intimin receptor Tir [Terracidiphilus sp.]
MTDREPRPPMRRMQLTGAILTDSHFLIPLVVFFAGLALLVAIH